jgi:hypothetical protein
MRHDEINAVHAQAPNNSTTSKGTHNMRVYVDIDYWYSY